MWHGFFNGPWRGMMPLSSLESRDMSSQFRLGFLKEGPANRRVGLWFIHQESFLWEFKGTPQCHPLQEKRHQEIMVVNNPLCNKAFFPGGVAFEGGTLRFSVTFRHRNCGRCLLKKKGYTWYTKVPKCVIPKRYANFGGQITPSIMKRRKHKTWRCDMNLICTYHLWKCFSYISPKKKHLNLWPTNNNPIGYWPTPPVAPWPFGRPPQQVVITGFSPRNGRKYMGHALWHGLQASTTGGRMPTTKWFCFIASCCEFSTLQVSGIIR